MLPEINKEAMKHSMDVYDTFIAARKKAIAAVDEFMSKRKEEPLYCGFGWVLIKPARGRFVNILKKAEIGDSAYGGGYRISYYEIMPRDHKYRITQSMDIKEIACEAFANELYDNHNLKAYAQSRAD